METEGEQQLGLDMDVVAEVVDTVADTVAQELDTEIVTPAPDKPEAHIGVLEPDTVDMTAAGTTVGTVADTRAVVDMEDMSDVRNGQMGSQVADYMEKRTGLELVLGRKVGWERNRKVACIVTILDVGQVAEMY